MDISPEKLVEVVVTAPVRGRFHYLVPEHLQGKLSAGDRLLVPFGRRKLTGFVMREGAELPPDLQAEKLKEVLAKLDPEPILPADIRKLVQFCANYYLAPEVEVLKAALPPGLTGASQSRYYLTAQGKEARAEGWTFPKLSQKAQELFSKSVSSGLLKSKVAAKAAGELVKAGLWVLRETIGAKDGEGEEEYIERQLSPSEAAPLLKRAPLRQRIYDSLEDGPLSIQELRQEIGRDALRNALKRLEADGVVVRKTRVATAESKTIKAPAQPIASAPELKLTPAQEVVYQSIVEAHQQALEGAPGQAFLLQGVTGSGKTEIYLATIEAVLKDGKSAIVLVPEIALTPQLEGRFKARFGDEVVVLHSGVADKERRRRFHLLRKGQARIALGPRSAIWAPVQNLGIIVVDEEHDGSFKQHSDVRYNGKDLALTRARQAGALTILGSATPCLESLNLVSQGKVKLLRLDQRVGGRPMPTIEVVDLEDERRALKGDIRLLSRSLEDHLRRVVEAKEQAILFLNRRGFNTVVHCGACGDVAKCPHCDVSLTHHKYERKLVCHYCGFEESIHSSCRSCQSKDKRPVGAGTQRVVEAVEKAIEGVRVLRLDRDATSKVGSLDATLKAFRNHEADVLVGTQMVAKGHDFPKVTLVGIVLADASLAFPDFRAAERSFQLITQVAGRAGRADHPGHVVIQTLQPDHYALRCALKHDVEAFFEVEARSRKEAAYPPFARMAAVRMESLDGDKAEKCIQQLSDAARQIAAGQEVRVAGPAPAPIGKIRDRFRYLILLFSPSPAKLLGVIRQLRDVVSNYPSGIDTTFDMDPLDLL